MKADFAHLHLHTQFSLLDSTIRLDELFKAALEDKMDAVAITDNGNLFGALDFYTKAKENGIQPILGCEVFLAPGGRKLRGNTGSGDDEIAPYSTGRSGLQHLILLCQNDVGYQNLCRLVSSGFLEGFYYKPRIDKEILAEFSEGLIATSACLKGEIASLCLMGDMDRARESAQWYRDVFKGRFYLELQQTGIPQQMLVNQRYQELAKDLGIPLIATADCHYIKKADAFSQEVLMAIQSGRVIEDPDGMELKTDEYYFKPQQVMKEEFSFCPEAIENTRKIAEQCSFEFKFKDASGKKIYHFPNFEPPDSKQPVDYLNEISREGLESRLNFTAELTGTEVSDRTPYVLRLERELSVINEMGFTGYFLIVSDFIRHAKTHGIPVGPGRGSGAGSLVAYSLGITELDPLEHGLLFERFLNPERVSLPDFDIDFCMDKRDRIIEYVSQKYGKDCVAQIITFGKLQARGVIRDVGRAFGMPVPEVDKIAKLVPETLNITLNDALAQEPRLQNLADKDPRVNRLMTVCRALEGLSRHASIHAAGLVISNRPMVEHCPLYRGKNDELVIQFDMNNADKIGLIKFDFLGLKTLTFLEAAERLIQKNHPEAKFELARIPMADKVMYEMLCKADTFGIFQMESSGMQDLMKRVRPDCFADIVAINALYRPGPIGSGMLDDYINRKHGTVPILYDFEELRAILHETYGVIVYQEQVQQVAMRLASYTAGAADILRRAMGKKKPEEMEKQKAIFLAGAQKNNFDPVRADKVFELMAKFAGYGFNKSHSAAYAMVTCQTAYIKCHYTVEFFAALLSIERENTDKITRYIADAARHGIQVLQPDINESQTDFTVLSPTQIRFGLGAIKGVGQIAIDSVLETRQKDGPFKDLFDLCSRTNCRTANKRVIEAFVKAGALDSFKIHRASLFAAIDSALELGSSMQKIMDEKQPSFSDLLGEDDATFTHRTITYPDEKPWDRITELKFEKETIGFYVTGHPLDDLEQELSRYTTGTIANVMLGGASKDCFIAGEVISLREIFTKKGDRMAFATLGDRTAEIEAVIFSDVYLEGENALKGDEPVWMRGTIETTDGNTKILLSKKGNGKILPLRYAYESLGREIHLYLPPSTNPQTEETQLMRLQTAMLAMADRQGVPVFLHVNCGKNAQTVLRLKEPIPLKRETVNSIRSLFSDETRLEFR